MPDENKALSPLEKTLLTGTVRRFRQRRPKWAKGSLNVEDSVFLATKLLEGRPKTAVEIGTASGYSAALQAYSLSLLKAAGLCDGDFEVHSYDILPTFYADPTKAVGDGALEQLPADLCAKITFRNPYKAIDLAKFHAPGTVDFLFIDADHKHPWPTLDLMATLPTLSPGCTVVLHDIALPLINPKFQSWGVKYLFDGLQIKKSKPSGDANIGSMVMPREPTSIRPQLERILYAQPWQREVPDDVLASLGLAPPPDVT